MQNTTNYLLKQYESLISWVNMYLTRLSDEDLKLSIAPGKNHGVWILGHLLASDDDLSLYLGKGPMLFPEYSDMFGQGSILKPVSEYPSTDLLREQWKEVTGKNKKIYSELKDEELSEPHAMIKGKTEDDFFKTKENCIINWQLHQMYHAGQLGVLYAMSGRDKII